MRAAARQLALRYFAVLDGGPLEELDGLLAPGFDTGVPGLPRGPVAYRQMLAGYRSAFADFHTHVEEVVAEADRVAVLTTTSGRHTGAFLGHAPTGAAFAATGIDLLWIEGERIARRAGAFDGLGMLQQLGLYTPVGDGR